MTTVPEVRPTIQFLHGAHIIYCHVMVPLALCNGMFANKQELDSPMLEDKLKALIEDMGYLQKVLAACGKRQKATGKSTSISYHLHLG